MTEHQEEMVGFDRLVAELQQEIDEQERGFYSDKVIEEAHDPSNLGRMADQDVRGMVRGWCGDTIKFYLRLDGERITEATFMTDGCGATVACGSMLTKMARGMLLEKAGEIMPGDLITALDGLPEEHAHCAELAVSTLQNALFNQRVSR